MKRLTQKILYDGKELYGSIGVPCDDLDYLKLIYDKLGQLEDIEEKIGIDLITLLKAQMQDTIYYKGYQFDYKIKECTVIYGSWIYIKGKPVYVLYLNYMDWSCGIQVYATDYGKTWALTKEELE